MIIVSTQWKGLTLIVSHALWPITLVVAGLGFVRAVDGDLKVVGSQTVTMGIGVREQTSLQREIKQFALRNAMTNKSGLLGTSQH